MNGKFNKTCYHIRRIKHISAHPLFWHFFSLEKVPIFTNVEPMQLVTIKYFLVCTVRLIYCIRYIKKVLILVWSRLGCHKLWSNWMGHDWLFIQMIHLPIYSLQLQRQVVWEGKNSGISFNKIQRPYVLKAHHRFHYLQSLH